MYTVEKDSVFDTLPIKDNLSYMPSINFDCIDIATRLEKLNVNKSEGPDGLHPRVLSETSELLAYPLKLIFEKISTRYIALRLAFRKYITIFKKVVN